jgi:hypothetical protein
LPVSVFGEYGQVRAEAMRFYTRDISSTGAFLEAFPEVPEGGQLDLVLHFSSLLGHGADMTARAEVVRREAGGLAVAFTDIGQTVAGHS